MHCPKFHTILRVDACLTRQLRAKNFPVGGENHYSRCLKCEAGEEASKGRMNDYDIEEMISKIPAQNSTTEIQVRNYGQDIKVRNKEQEEIMRSKLEPAPEGMKRCSKCKESKPKNKENFGADKKSKDGFRYFCRKCDATLAKERRLKRHSRLVEKSTPAPAAPEVKVRRAYRKSKVRIEDLNPRPTARLQARDAQLVLNLNFSNFPEVVDKIADLAAKELRSPENQAVWILKEQIEGLRD